MSSDIEKTGSPTLPEETRHDEGLWCLDPDAVERLLDVALTGDRTAREFLDAVTTTAEETAHAADGSPCLRCRRPLNSDSIRDATHVIQWHSEPREEHRFFYRAVLCARCATQTPPLVALGMMYEARPSGGEEGAVRIGSRPLA